MHSEFDSLPRHMIDLDKALAPVRELIENGTTKYTDTGDLYDRWFSGRLGPDESARNIRLDFELASPEIPETTSELADMVLDILKADLEDLLENGDTSITHDPVLKVFDGSKKRGREVAEFVVLAVQVENNFHWRKDTVEYTVYIIPYVRWA